MRRADAVPVPIPVTYHGQYHEIFDLWVFSSTKIDSALGSITRSGFFLFDNRQLSILFNCHGVSQIT
jgi:hypothetical protein